MVISAEPEAQLFDYGIHNEASNIRAHVGVLAKTLFVFPTVCAVRVMPGFAKKGARQPGVNGITAEGYCVPPAAIPNLRRLAIAEERLVGFDDDLSTSEKGNRAVAIVTAFLKAGRFPLWLEGDFVTDPEIQITGTDIRVRGNWKIEVKCDYRASDTYGKPHWNCTGNLYLQIAERNPLRRI